MGDGLTFLNATSQRTNRNHWAIRPHLVHILNHDRCRSLHHPPRVLAEFAEETFQGAIDPHTPVAQGWLRASHRKLDPALSTPYRPYHTHDETQPLTPGEIVRLDIELWPTSIVAPAGYRLALTVRGRDYVYPGGGGGRLSNFKNELTGCGPFLHDDPQDRPPEIFGGRTTLHAAPGQMPSLLLPVIPPQTESAP